MLRVGSYINYLNETSSVTLIDSIRANKRNIHAKAMLKNQGRLYRLCKRRRRARNRLRHTCRKMTFVEQQRDSCDSRRGNCDLTIILALSFLSLTINFGGGDRHIHICSAECAVLPRDLLGDAITRGVTSNFIATRGIMRPTSSRED